MDEFCKTLFPGFAWICKHPDQGVQGEVVRLNPAHLSLSAFFRLNGYFYATWYARHVQMSRYLSPRWLEAEGAPGKGMSGHLWI